MGVTLTKGGNVSLSRQAAGLTAVRVGIGWQEQRGGGAAQGADASALLCGADSRVLSENHFVFFNNPRSPDGSVRLLESASPSAPGATEDEQQIGIDLTTLAPEVEKIVFPLSLEVPEGGNRTFSDLGAVHVRVYDQDGGTPLARFDLAASAAGETAMVLGEIYRRGAEWKFRAVGQGYSTGLAGIAEDFGIDVLAETTPPPEAVKSAVASAASPDHPEGVPAPFGEPAPIGTEPAGPMTGSAASVGPSYGVPAQPAPFPAEAPLPPYSQNPTGSLDVTCFFDPNHGPGTTPVMWSPQWGVPRQIQSCGSCAQRVQTTPPPFYTPAQAGYPQAGYPQPGYLQQSYGDPYHGDHHGSRHHEDHHHGEGQQRRFGMGAVVGAGAAGLVGGALINEALDDDEPDVVINEFDGDGDNGFF